jgi:rare lipoprotein A (peptidoglycan hydrolase)
VNSTRKEEWMMRCSFRGWCVLTVVAVMAVALLAAARPASTAEPKRVQLGLASYYGPGFHGEETASGEIFDQREMVAAHRPCPSARSCA